MNINEQFQWKCQPEAENYLLTFLDRSIKTNTTLKRLEEDLLILTSTRLFDWIDHLVIPDKGDTSAQLASLGFTKENGYYEHLGAQLPRVQLSTTAAGVALFVESIAEFLMARGIQREIEGTPFSGYRRCLIDQENGISLWVVERRGNKGQEPIVTDSKAIENYLIASEAWLSRARSLDNEEAAFDNTFQAAERLIHLVGKNTAAWIAMEGERKYWQSRNAAGQVQKNRQDRLGMGWANHDHHTFRSSRKNFVKLVHLFEMLGFHCRERFYAGAEAGWGAQVMENSEARLVLFLDVDLSSEELEIDFAHNDLPETAKLGTIGLWCALHGDSILKAGMHHLEAQFMFDDLTHDLAIHGVGMMKPFSSFTYLKQAFTAGENWPVNPEKVRQLEEKGQLTADQAEKFIKQGAIGSHMENLQRREGYKGFNQNNVSFIIRETDPRTIHATGD